MSDETREVRYQAAQKLVELDMLLARYNGGIKELVVHENCLEAFGALKGEKVVMRLAAPTGYITIRAAE